jgi:hypothetical protein
MRWLLVGLKHPAGVYFLKLVNGVYAQGATPLSITTFSTMTLSIKGLFATFNTMTIRIMTIGKTKLCQYAECHYAECRILIIVMLNVIMLSVAF